METPHYGIRFLLTSLASFCSFLPELQLHWPHQAQPCVGASAWNPGHSYAAFLEVFPNLTLARSDPEAASLLYSLLHCSVQSEMFHLLSL